MHAPPDTASTPAARVSYAHGTSDIPLFGQTLGESFERTVARYPDAEALVSRHQGLRFTYAQLDDAVNRVARALLAAGLERGDRLGIWSPNYAEWVAIQYAAAKTGTILVNVNPGYRVPELQYALNLTGTRLLIAAPSFKTSDYVAMVEQARPGVPALERAVYLHSPGWDEFLAGAEDVPEQRLRERMGQVQFDDPINIQFTSGTTGSPKGATLTHHNILNNGFFIAESLRYTPADRVCIPVPFYHNFGMTLGNIGCTTHGSCIVIPSDAFDAGAVLAAIDAERCTSVYGVPTMYIAELEHPDFDSFDFSSMRTGIMAGSPCPIEVMREVHDRMHMHEIAICYGMTETSSVTTQTALDDPLERRVTTVGRVHPHMEIKIVDPETGAIVPRGQPGELLTRGYCVMLGYWEDSQRTADSIDAQRWMHTGDLATMDDEGYVNIVGRIKDMIIRGGENLFPSEIEQFLHTNPHVRDVAVVGVPDQRFGEEALAWVILHDGADVDEDDIRDFCRGQIAHYKIPRYVRFTDSFPMTVTGKIQKARLRELALEALGLHSTAEMQTA